MEGLPQNYRDNITVDNGVEIIWVNQKGQVIPNDKGGSPSSAADDDADIVVGMPRVVSIKKSAVAAEVNGNLPASPGGTRRVSASGTVSPSPQLIGAWFTNGPDNGGGGAPGSPTGSTGPPETEDDDADPEGHPCMALEPYARDMYNTVRKGLLGKKRTPMETLLSWKGKQIAVPLTIACNQNKAVSSECVSLFGDIMVYMGDKKGKESGMQLLKGLETRLLASTQDFRDEIFCQVFIIVVSRQIGAKCCAFAPRGDGDCPPELPICAQCDFTYSSILSCGKPCQPNQSAQHGACHNSRRCALGGERVKPT